MKAAGLFLLFFLSHQSVEAHNIEAQSWVLFKTPSGEILDAFEPDKRFSPASLTKVLTAYVVFKEIKEGRLSLRTQIEVPALVLQTRPGESQMQLKPGEYISIRELLKGLIVVSANDAALALANHVGGSLKRFVGMMNLAAQEIGMQNSSLVNPTGLFTFGHYSTARDLMKLAQAISQKHPEYFEYSSLPELTYNQFRKKNTNELLGSSTAVDGMKTGYIKASGWCVMISAKKALAKGGERTIAVVLGSPSHQKRIQAGRELIRRGLEASAELD
nr:hypothetical protein BdHM001_17210 [Bdellovibrio sp. HM001]